MAAGVDMLKSSNCYSPGLNLCYFTSSLWRLVMNRWDVKQTIRTAALWEKYEYFPQWVTVLICIKVDWLVYLFTTHANVVWTFKLLQLFLRTFHEQQIGFNVSCNLPANNPIYCYFAARSCQVHICSMANHMWIKKGMFPLVNKFVCCKLAAALPLSNKYNSRIKVLVQNYFVYTSIKCSGDTPDLEVKYCEVKIMFLLLNTLCYTGDS